MLRYREAEPWVLPRWTLYLIYSLFVLLGGVLATAGSPSIDLTTPNGYLTFYGISISLVAVIAVVGSRFPKHPVHECAAAFLLFALLSVYIASTIVPWIHGDTGRGSLGVVVTIASCVPLVRSITLFTSMLRAERIRRSAL